MPITSSWKVVPTGLNRLSNEKIGSAGIDSTPIELALEDNLSLDGGGVPAPGGPGSLSINARGGLSQATFNSSDDVDEDGLLSSDAGETLDGKLVPPLTFNPTAAWVKYRCSAGVKASGALSLGDVGFNVDANAGIAFADYRLHSPDALLRDTVVRDLLEGPARFVTAVEHVRALAENEALAMVVNGQLSGAAQVAWTDIFTGAFGALAPALGAVSGLTIAADVGASIKATVAVQDSFVVVFSCTAAHRQWRLAVRKSRSATVSPRVDAGVTVSFPEQAQVTALVDPLVEAVLGQALSTVSRWLGAANVDALPETERRLLRAVLARVGLDPDAPLAQLSERLDTLRKDARDKVEEIARSKIAISFMYEYTRVDEQVSLLQVLLDDAGLTAFHAPAVSGRLDVVTDAIAAGKPGLSLETYLNHSILRRERSWGFTLGIGTWISAGGTDFSKLRRTRRLNVAGHPQDGYFTIRGYDGRFGRDHFSWSVDFKADMKDFARSAIPVVGEFDIGLHLAMVDDQARLSDDELSQWLDLGVLWHAIDETDIEPARGQLRGLEGTGCSASAQITIGDGVLRALLPALAGAPAAAFADAFAAAMPYMPDFPERRSVALRRIVYGDLWRAYFASASPGHRPTRVEMAVIGAAALRSRRLDVLAAFEDRQRDPQRPLDPLAFAGLVELNGDSASACSGFSRALTVLQSSGANADDTMPLIFRSASGLWAQSHHVRAIGAYLLEAARRQSLLGEIRRVLTVTPKQGKAIVLTA
jgi:hypothetical protein